MDFRPPAFTNNSQTSNLFAASCHWAPFISRGRPPSASAEVAATRRAVRSRSLGPNDSRETVSRAKSWPMVMNFRADRRMEAAKSGLLIAILIHYTARGGVILEEPAH